MKIQESHNEEMRGYLHADEPVVLLSSLRESATQGPLCFLPVKVQSNSQETRSLSEAGGCGEALQLCSCTDEAVAP